MLDSPTPEGGAAPRPAQVDPVAVLAERALGLDHQSAADLLAGERDAVAADVLQSLVPSLARSLLELMPAQRRQHVLAAATPESRRQWAIQAGYPEESVGRLMEAPLGVFAPEQAVRETVAELRQLVERAFITYAFVCDPAGRLLGVITMRDLLFSQPEARLGEVMLRDPFALRADLPLVEAMRQVLNRHYPVYPVCDAEGRLLGLVRGQALFEAQAIELSAQAGAMVGVEKEERLATPLARSLRFRFPWLQLNIFTAFVAAAVVGLFQDTIDRMVVLAAFLPVLAGQSGNTGCQALAVALRGLTLGELKPGKERRLIVKEALLGVSNGALVGITAAVGMFIYARVQGGRDAPVLALIVFLAMTFSCMVSGIAGAAVPVILKRLGADPATASSIFLTTATDVASMGLFLSLATVLIPA
jgi:magnesium transporter